MKLRALTLSLIVPLTLCGCSARYAGQTGDPGVSDHGLHGSIALGQSFADVIVGAALLSILVAANQDDSSGAVPMAPGRRINAQDCSKPIADLGANLLCR